MALKKPAEKGVKNNASAGFTFGFALSLALWYTCMCVFS